MDPSDIEPIEVDLLLEALYRRYGYDFRAYGRASITRRLRHYLARTQYPTLAALIPAVLHDEEVFQALFFDLSVTATEMFRDPWFFAALRTQVCPFLRTFPYLNIWTAGCATGEEVYSLAIMLKEEGLYERTRLYATDFNDAALEHARARIYPLERMKEYSANYLAAGGQRSLADYFHAHYHALILDAALAAHVTFANHNLTTDGVFGEMHLVLCRNVLIYFERPLQNRVLTLLRDSLCRNGFLCLGAKETLAFSECAPDFSEYAGPARIYQFRPASP